MAGTAAAITGGQFTDAGRAAGIDGAIRIAQDHRELQLWVEAGIPPAVALQAATSNAAKLLRADRRIGLIAPGLDANILIVDGDPTRDISATERISMVVLKGERVRRVDLFDAAKNPLQ